MNRTARLFAAAVLICLADDAAVAACRDSPEPGVDWSGCDKTKVMLRGDDLRNANLTSADVSRADLAGADLSGATLVDATLTRTRLAGAKLVGADLSKAMFDRANLAAADLAPAVLEDNYAGAGIGFPALSAAGSSRRHEQQADHDRSHRAASFPTTLSAYSSSCSASIVPS